MASQSTEKMGYNGYPSPTWNQQMAPPPPAYTYSQQLPQTHQPTPTHSYPRTLDVNFTSWSGRHVRVTEGTVDGPLVYAADLKLRKPHMLFQAEGTAQLPATVIFHSFSRTIDVNINGQDIPMKPTSRWKYEFGFESPALGGKRLTWKQSRNWKWLDIKCVDENGTVYANFVAHKGWSVKKAGKLELQQPCAMEKNGLTDELVVTGLASVYLQFTQTMSANAAAAAAAS